VKSDGRFASASLEPYLDSSIHWSDDAASWSWDANPFLGTRQLKGLKILVMLFANWDNKDARDLETSWTTAGTPGSNTAILTYPSGEARYLVTDWGASMGTWGSYLTRSKWNCTGFDLQTKEFVKVGRGDVLQWGYLGRHTQDFVADIELDDVHWLLMYLGRITDAQLKAGRPTACLLPFSRFLMSAPVGVPSAQARAPVAEGLSCTDHFTTLITTPPYTRLLYLVSLPKNSGARSFDLTASNR
jgi:hypothetical protein